MFPLTRARPLPRLAPPAIQTLSKKGITALFQENDILKNITLEAINHIYTIAGSCLEKFKTGLDLSGRYNIKAAERTFSKHDDIEYKLPKLQIAIDSIESVTVYIKTSRLEQNPKSTKGTTKHFEEAIALKLSTTEDPAIKKVARLTVLIDDLTEEEHEWKLEQFDHEIAVLNDFPNSETICKLYHAFQRYQGKYGKVKIEKTVIYEELCPHRDLFEYKEKLQEMHEPDKTALTLAIIKDILRALVDFHKPKSDPSGATFIYIHRDIKVENFFIASIPSLTGKNQIKLCDFGTSYRIDDPSVNNAEGTAALYPPERMKKHILNLPEFDAVDLTQKVDTWAMGVIIYMLLTNSEPSLNYLNSCLVTTTALIDILNNPNSSEEEFKPTPLGNVKKILSSSDSLINKVSALSLNDKAQLIEELGMYSEGVSGLCEDLDKILPETLADLTLGENHISDFLQKQEQNLSELSVEIVTLLISFKEHCQVSNEDEIQDLKVAFEALKKGINDLAAKLQEKLELTWDALEKQPEPDELPQKILWKLLRPDPRERISAKEALDSFIAWQP